MIGEGRVHSPATLLPTPKKERGYTLDEARMYPLSFSGDSGDRGGETSG